MPLGGAIHMNDNMQRKNILRLLFFFDNVYNFLSVIK